MMRKWWQLWLLAAAVAGLVTGCAARPSGEYKTLQQGVAALLADESCPGGNAADLQTLINATPAGETVRIPAGCYLIDESVAIPGGREVVGAGMDQTVFYRDPQAFRGQSGAMLLIFGRAEGVTRISNLALVGVRDTDDSGEDYGVQVHGNRQFRIDHCYFEGFGFAAVRTEGQARGVIDHSLFVDNFKQGIDNLGYGVAVYGENRWPDDPAAGSAEAVFIEDNLFVGSRHAVAANAGAHYVFRHNLVQENVVACAVDAHGMGYGSSHGTRYVEIYGNIIERPADNWCGIGIRGGEGVIFDNTIRGYRNPILLVLEWGTPAALKDSYPAFEQVQALYIWDNDIQRGPSKPQIEREARGFIEQERDYFLTAKPNYQPFTYPHPLVDGGTLSPD